MKNKYINKLGQLEDSLEDFENEYGIDLGILAKLYTTGCWGLYREEEEDGYGNCSYDVLHFPPQAIKVDSENNDLIILDYRRGVIDNSSIEVFTQKVWIKYKLTEYGETWALTKKELL